MTNSDDIVDQGAPLSGLEQSVAGFMNTWIEQTEQAASSIEVPEVLYHYTDVRGLLGIIQTGKLWATSAPFLNDQTELSHSLVLLREIIEGRHDHDAGIPQDIADSYLLELIENFYLIFEMYLVCFCQSWDLLSQWRAYGQGQGYAIGFRSDQISSMAFLKKVTYQHSEQATILSEFVKRWRDLISAARPDDLSTANRRMVTLSLATALVRTILAFKNQAFEDEREWRLVRPLPSFFPEQLQFRERAGMVMPYVELAPSADGVTGPRGEVLLPISEIWMGPRRDHNIAGHGLGKLLLSRGYLEVKIHSSVVPLRTEL